MRSSVARTISSPLHSSQTKKRKWLDTFLDLDAGIPSHDRFNAILAAIKPEEFEKCLLEWITALHEITDGQVIAIDGKTLRRSYDKASSKSAIHMVSDWATMNHISLGQVVTDAKSNEITAIPKLLQILELSGALVTIDAMGCQTKIAQEIVDAGANYCLAVKKNQPTLHQGIVDFFGDHKTDDFARTKVRRVTTHDKKHGREVTREYFICPVPENLPDGSRWANLKAIGFTINTTIHDGKVTTEVRYYILSRFVSGDRFAEAVRTHWGIENNLHWQLDVTFQEDQVSHPQRPRRHELQHPTPHCFEPTEKRTYRKNRHQKQTPHRRLGRGLSDQSPAGVTPLWCNRPGANSGQRNRRARFGGNAWQRLLEVSLGASSAYACKFLANSFG